MSSQNRNRGDGGSEEKKIEWRIPEWFKDIEQDDLIRLQYYHVELLRFNKKINLISANSMFDADLVHFADSIIAGRLILKDCKCKVIYDFGSGNGFPGLVMALLDKSREFVLVEADGRKAEFLKHVVSRLEFKHVRVEVARIENLPENSVECGVSRGLAQISRSLMMTRKIFKVGGRFYHVKGDHWTVELAGIPSQLCSVWEPALLGEYRLPMGSSHLAVVVTAKIERN